MHKAGFTIIEVVVVFLLILGVTFFILPMSLDTTRQARFISKWSEKYSQLEYMFSVIKAQKDSEIQQGFDTAQTNDDRRKIILEQIKPYLRITSEVKSDDYHQYYMNGDAIGETGLYYFKNFYLTDADEVIGLKWIKEDCTDGNVCGIMSFDVNGINPPNTWGYDVYGINIMKDKIEPIGKNIDQDTLKKNCSKKSYGVYCSYYYLIGGKFD